MSKTKRVKKKQAFSKQQIASIRSLSQAITGLLNRDIIAHNAYGTVHFDVDKFIKNARKFDSSIARLGKIGRLISTEITKADKEKRSLDPTLFEKLNKVSAAITLMNYTIDIEAEGDDLSLSGLPWSKSELKDFIEEIGGDVSDSEYTNLIAEAFSDEDIQTFGSFPNIVMWINPKSRLGAKLGTKYRFTYNNVSQAVVNKIQKFTV